MTSDVESYIRENRARYTRDAITSQLVAAGHDPAVVEEAWARADAAGSTGDADASGADAPSDSGGTSAFIGVYTLIVFALGGLVQVALTVTTVGTSYATPAQQVASVIGLALYVTAAILAYRLTYSAAKRARAGTGWAIAVGCLMPVAVIGICTAAAIPAGLVR